MKRRLTTSLAVGVLSCLTSCSCGIFRDGFAPVKRPMTDDAVKQVAMTNGFSQRSNEHGAARFKNRDINLLYNNTNQLVVVRSSLCPLFSIPRYSAEWQSRCKTMSSKIAGDFHEFGVPVRKLSSEEQIKRNQGGHVFAPNRSLPHSQNSTSSVRGSED